MAGATLGSVASALVTVVVAVDSDEVVSDGTVDVAADAAAVSMPLVGDACVVELEALPHEASATVMPSASPKADRRTGGQADTYVPIHSHQASRTHSAIVSHVSRVTECRTRCDIS